MNRKIIWLSVALVVLTVSLLVLFLTFYIEKTRQNKQNTKITNRLGCSNSPPLEVTKSGYNSVYLYTTQSGQWVYVPVGATQEFCVNDGRVWLSFLPVFGTGYFDVSSFLNIPKLNLNYVDGLVTLNGPLTDVTYPQVNGTGGPYTFRSNATTTYGSGWTISDGTGEYVNLDPSITNGYGCCQDYTSTQMNLPGTSWITINMFLYDGDNRTADSYTVSIFPNISIVINNDKTGTYSVNLTETTQTTNCATTSLRSKNVRPTQLNQKPQSKQTDLQSQAQQLYAPFKSSILSSLQSFLTSSILPAVYLQSFGAPGFEYEVYDHQSIGPVDCTVIVPITDIALDPTTTQNLFLNGQVYDFNIAQSDPVKSEYTIYFFVGWPQIPLNLSYRGSCPLVTGPSSAVVNSVIATFVLTCNVIVSEAKNNQDTLISFSNWNGSAKFRADPVSITVGIPGIKTVQKDVGGYLTDYLNGSDNPIASQIAAAIQSIGSLQVTLKQVNSIPASLTVFLIQTLLSNPGQLIVGPSSNSQISNFYKLSGVSSSPVTSSSNGFGVCVSGCAMDPKCVCTLQVLSSVVISGNGLYLTDSKSGPIGAVTSNNALWIAVPVPGTNQSMMYLQNPSTGNSLGANPQTFQVYTTPNSSLWEQWSIKAVSSSGSQVRFLSASTNQYLGINATTTQVYITTNSSLWESFTCPTLDCFSYTGGFDIDKLYIPQIVTGFSQTTVYSKWLSNGSGWFPPTSESTFKVNYATQTLTLRYDYISRLLYSTTGTVGYLYVGTDGLLYIDAALNPRSTGWLLQSPYNYVQIISDYTAPPQGTDTNVSITYNNVSIGLYGSLQLNGQSRFYLETGNSIEQNPCYSMFPAILSL